MKLIPNRVGKEIQGMLTRNRKKKTRVSITQIGNSMNDPSQNKPFPSQQRRAKFSKQLSFKDSNAKE